MADSRTGIHLIAGGLGGTAGAVFTCPLEVVKTRQQSSIAIFHNQYTLTRLSYMPPQPVVTANFTTYSALSNTNTATTDVTTQAKPRSNSGLVKCIKHIIQNEGPRGLFKGLGPNLIGVAPSRAIYFYSYAQAKNFLNSTLVPETPLVHILSASCAGFWASTLTNPIWFIKTRLQLDQKRNGGLTAWQCSRQIYQTGGIARFYKGITASYYGISETVIHFVIYEHIKAQIREFKRQNCVNEIDIDERTAFDFFEFMAAGATSKTIATCVAYPHEVVRTRLRQEGTKYRGFWQTLSLVAKEEGPRGMYRGLCTQLVRQIPNTAIMMSTYEAVVYFCNKHL